MKTRILFSVCCLLFALRVGAQSVFDFGLANNIRTQQTVTAASFVTNTVGTNVTYGAGITNAVKNLALNQYLGAMLAFTPLGTNVGDATLTVTFARSVDGVTYETSPRFTWSVAITGTNALAYYTNLSPLIGPAAYLTNISVVSTETNTALTNVSLKLGGKYYLR